LLFSFFVPLFFCHYIQNGLILHEGGRNVFEIACRMLNIEGLSGNLNYVNQKS
jgi:hypothetical protein